jgi:hypothetical protein
MYLMPYFNIHKYWFYTAINVVPQKAHRNSANINEVPNKLRLNYEFNNFQ